MLTDTTLDQLGETLAGLLAYLSLHPSDPALAGDSLVTVGSPLAIAWTVGGGGDLVLTDPAAFTGCTPGADVTWVGLWSDGGLGTFRGSIQLSGDGDPNDFVVNTDGDYTVDTLTIVGSSY